MLQGELGRWNCLVLEGLNVFMQLLKLVATVQSAEDLSGLLNPSLNRFSPVSNV
jgi:hypothetical protein